MGLGQSREEMLHLQVAKRQAGCGLNSGEMTVACPSLSTGCSVRTVVNEQGRLSRPPKGGGPLRS